MRAINAIALEAVAAMAVRTIRLDPEATGVTEALLRRHFDRKHVPGAYYGRPPSSGFDPCCPIRRRSNGISLDLETGVQPKCYPEMTGTPGRRPSSYTC
jgi:hypothetical protein